MLPSQALFLPPTEDIKVNGRTGRRGWLGLGVGSMLGGATNDPMVQRLEDSRAWGFSLSVAQKVPLCCAFGPALKLAPPAHYYWHVGCTRPPVTRSQVAFRWANTGHSYGNFFVCLNIDTSCSPLHTWLLSEPWKSRSYPPATPSKSCWLQLIAPVLYLNH